MGPWLPDPRADQIQEAGSRAIARRRDDATAYYNSGERKGTQTRATQPSILEVIISQYENCPS